MKKERKISFSLIGIMLIVMLGTISYMSSVAVNSSMARGITGNLIFEPTDHITCSDQEIINQWNAIFVESSDGIKIIKNTTNGCVYIAYKNRTINDEVYVLANYGFIFTAWKGVLVQSYYNNLTSSSSFDDPFFSTSGFTSELFKLRPSEVINKTMASKVLSDTYEISVTSDLIEEKTSSDFKEGKIYTYTSDKTTENNYASLTYSVSGNYSLVSLVYLLFSGNCTPNWTYRNTNCTSDESYIRYYFDSNNCGTNVNKPENETIGCDYNGNGIIGFANSSLDGGLKVLIGDNELNLSVNYTGVKLVSIKDDNQSIIEFDWDFSVALAPSDIELEMNSENATNSFIIINGLNITKTVYLEQSSESNELCIVDDEIQDIGEISVNCNASNELYLFCPGNASGLECRINNSQYIISGLKHSGILELNDLSLNCTPNWSCSAWQECINGVQIRTCTDLNKCNVTTGIPEETKVCSASCVPLWSCQPWSNCTNGRQIRVCTDVNNCNVNENKPELSKECENEFSLNYSILFTIIGILVLVGIVIAIIIHFLNKQAEDSEFEDSTSNNFGFKKSPPGSPSSGFSVPNKRLIQNNNFNSFQSIQQRSVPVIPNFTRQIPPRPMPQKI